MPGQVPSGVRLPQLCRDFAVTLLAKTSSFLFREAIIREILTIVSLPCGFACCMTHTVSAVHGGRQEVKDHHVPFEGVGQYFNWLDALRSCTVEEAVKESVQCRLPSHWPRRCIVHHDVVHRPHANPGKRSRCTSRIRMLNGDSVGVGGGANGAGQVGNGVGTSGGEAASGPLHLRPFEAHETWWPARYVKGVLAATRGSESRRTGPYRQRCRRC